MGKKIAVLCRGKSLQHIDLLPDDIDEFIIVNRFAEELRIDSIKDKIGNKPITHVFSLGETHEQGFFKEYNIKEIVLPYVDECMPTNSNIWGNPRPQIEGKNGIIPLTNLSSKIKKYMWTPDIDPRPEWHPKKPFDLPTSGMASVCHAAITLNADDVYIIGMDFYDGVGYAYGTDFGPDTVKLGTHEGEQETEPMKQFLTDNLAKKLPNKNFNIYTLSNYNPQLDNVNVIKLGDEKRKIAVIAGGWHFPNHFYKEMIKQQIPYNWEVDYFCVSHRNPELEIVYEEKKKLLSEYCTDENDIFNILDHYLYEKPISIKEIEDLGWNYIEKPNMMGDFNFINQWMEDNNYEEYDALLSTHDDNYIFRYDLFTSGILQYNWNDWLTIANGADIVPGNVSNMRGSFAIFKTSLIMEMGGGFNTNNVTLTREGETHTPFKSWSMDNAISDWNHIAANFGDFIKNNNLSDKVKRLSNQYRISDYCFEGERGFLSRGGPDQMPSILKYIEENFEFSYE